MNNLSEILLENFIAYKSLIYLSLINCKINSCNFLDYLNGNKDLKLLNISFNSLRGQLNLENACLKSLEDFYLENTNVQLDFSNLIDVTEKLKELNIINSTNIIFSKTLTKHSKLRFLGISVINKN